MLVRQMRLQKEPGLEPPRGGAFRAQDFVWEELISRAGSVVSIASALSRPTFIIRSVVTESGAMRWTRAVSSDEGCDRRTAKSCGPDPSMLGSSFARSF